MSAGAAGGISGVQEISADCCPVLVALQKNRLPRHMAVHVRVPRPGESFQISISCSGQPILPEVTEDRLAQPHRPVKARLSAIQARAEGTIRRPA